METPIHAFSKENLFRKFGKMPRKTSAFRSCHLENRWICKIFVLKNFVKLTTIHDSGVLIRFLKQFH